MTTSMPLIASAATKALWTASGLFEDDVLLPVQFAGLARSHARTAEQRLMCAVLEEALDDICSLQVSAAQRIDAYRWLHRTDRLWLFSAVNICDVLALDIDYVRRGVRAKLARREALRHVRQPVIAQDQMHVQGRRRTPAQL